MRYPLPTIVFCLLLLLCGAFPLLAQIASPKGMPPLQTFTPAQYGNKGKIWDIATAPNGIVYMAADSHRPLDPDFALADERVSFADGFPYLITNQASLDELSRHYGAEVAMLRSRMKSASAWSSPPRPVS